MTDVIKVGDQVVVRFWPMYSDIRGEVRATPQSQGDSWVIVSENGDVHYVQTFASITKEAPASDDTPF